MPTIDAKATKFCEDCGEKLGCKNKSGLCGKCYSSHYKKEHRKSVPNRHCKACGIELSLTNRSNLCRKCYKAQHNKEHRALYLEAASKKYRLDIDKSRAASRKRALKSYYENLPLSRLNHRLYCHNNAVKINYQVRVRYRKDLMGNREKDRIKSLCRPYLTKDILQRVYERNIAKYGSLTCYLCGRPISYKGQSAEYAPLGRDNLEHLVPVIRGGTHTLDNMDIAHATCNQRKGRLTYQECLEQSIMFPPVILKEVA